MLHILRQSPFNADLDTLLRCMNAGDDLLLLQDGVIAAIKGGRYLELLLEAPISISALQEDLEARGLAAQISSKIDTVSYNDFVRLTIKHERQMTW
ncbi:sulfurtransferase complex subunit TusB [Enterobacteriaceae bacterium H20N1]|uniref:Protein TusB n=1 Tax=Dryocola boscaweniae TaxID=2925397 RepID=A0A9X2W9B8_9ENTR|nr:sulfurtransferase complex subunit TusB [Dryocola boscaweniae]MCT4703508.1 sulfurtransferase complex subunit TusB [Dryocola boscaweniae]MCT4715892.1 sulfurtransferase complex subunit TusB [Dryocola boscaweniae]MCT4720676.1 sulfurtransferase complex subunit TusB [Dryocola boscaweniae]